MRGASECYITLVNLTICLNKANTSPSGKQKQAGGSNHIIATGPSIPFHLIDIDLSLLKGVEIMFSKPCIVNFVGVKAYCRPRVKVHICVHYNFPIALYGRLLFLLSPPSNESLVLKLILEVLKAL